MTIGSRCSRRSLFGLILGGGAVLAGCDTKAPAGRATTDRPKSPAAPDDKALLVYRDPACGCCEAWADIARGAGYAVTVENRSDMSAVKARFGVPQDLASCHTAIIADYVIEGHVPMAHIARLLRDKPRGIIGIAVPGMPRGSPGMEMPDGSKDAFDVLAFDRAGRISAFPA
jgi:hypothetical protein